MRNSNTSYFPITWSTLKEVKPVTLKQRVLEAAEQKRALKIHKDSVALEQALMRAGVIQNRLPPGALKVTKQGHVRYDLDGVLFYLHSWVNQEYDDNTGEVTAEREVSQLNAQLICSYEGCHRGINWPSVSNVRKLDDLSPLFDSNDQRTTEPYCDLYGRNGRPDRHNGKNDDGSDIYGFDPDEFSELPF